MRYTPIERARRGDLTGLNIAGLVRLSFELDPTKERVAHPMSGTEINGRDDQERRCRDYVESRGGTYVHTYNEPDTSAWKKHKIKQDDGSFVYRVVRPVFEGALGDLKQGLTPSGGRLDGMIVYDLDRLTRDNRHMEDAIEVVQYFNRPILDIYGTLDLLTDNGRANARMRVTMAGDQSAATSRRVRDKHYIIALNGIPIGGNRPFGWNQDKRTLKLDESELLKQAAQLVVRKVGITTIVKHWADQGVLSPGGKPIGKRSLEVMLLSPRIVGWRVYGAQTIPLPERYIKDAAGLPIRGQHQPILDLDLWHQVVAQLTDPRRRSSNGTMAGKRKYMLSGIMRCSECGNRLIAYATQNGRHAYACKKTVELHGCGKVSGSGIPIDQMLSALAIAYLAERKFETAPVVWAGSADLEALELHKQSLLQQFKDNTDMGAYIWPQIREADASIAALLKDRSQFGKTQQNLTASASDRFDELEVEQKRAICEELFEAVILSPGKRYTNRFDESRVTVVWRQV
jgi:DNA invertase Pin-like site-specific DNA recombinase